MKHAIPLLLASCLFSLGAAAQEEAPRQADPAEQEEVYIPRDLDDAVRELNRLIRPEDKELIKKGLDSGGVHF